MKKNSKDDKITVDSLNDEVSKLNSQIDKLDTKVSRFTAERLAMKKHFDAYINRQFTEIRIVEKNDDGKWGDYSGVFYITPSEERKFLIQKAEKHFNTYFKDSIWHRNKHLGLFLSNKKREKTLVKTMITGDYKGGTK